MKKIITIISVFFVSLCFLSIKKIEAIVDITPDIYEEVPNINYNWTIISEGEGEPIFISDLISIKRNQIYMLPIYDGEGNYYIEMHARYYDENKELIADYSSFTHQSNKKNFDWARYYQNGLTILIMILKLPENSKFVSFEMQSLERDSNEVATENINAFVRLHRLKTDDIPPVIQGQGVYITNVDHPVLLSDIKNQLEAYDNVDGNISSNLVVKSDSYTGNESTVGSYKVVFECTDSAFNVAQYEVLIKVFDVTDPSLESMEYEVICSMSDAEKTIEQIKALLSARDNVDGDLTEHIIVIEDNYSGNEDKTGRYNIIFKVCDEAGNFTTCEVFITVKDNIPPIILVEGTIIPISVFDELTFEDIKAILLEYLTEQNLLVEEIYEISNEYDEHKDKTGNYNIKLGYKLANGHTEEIDLNVLVYEPQNNIETPFINSNNFTVYYVIGAVVVLGLITSIILIGYKKRANNTN